MSFFYPSFSDAVAHDSVIGTIRPDASDFELVAPAGPVKNELYPWPYISLASPRWAPDGSALFYHQVSGGVSAHAICRMLIPPEGKEQHCGPLVHPPIDVSADNGRIAVTSWGQEVPGHWIGATGWDRIAGGFAPVRDLFRSDSRPFQSPAWAPTGATVAFYSGNSADQRQVVVGDDVSSAFQTVIRVTDQYKPDWAGTYPVLDWSPDGNWIAYEDAGAIWVTDAQGADEPSRIADGYSPSWRP